MRNSTSHRTRRTGRWLEVGAAASMVVGLLTGTAAGAAGSPRVASAAASPRPAVAEADDAAPARAVIERLIGSRRIGQLTLRTIDGDGPDRYRVRADRGRLVVEGTTPAVQLAGFGAYLRQVAHADVSLGGDQLDLPPRLPLPASPIEQDASVQHRFALNDTNEGYAGAYLSWADWQHRIDVLALHGINEVLVYEGQEAVYQRTYAEFGYTADEMRQWIPQPGHQAWWLLQNMCCVDGPISQQLIDQRIELGRKITGHLRELGMTPVLPGYFGTVPSGFEDRNPQAHTVPQGTWNLLQRPDWLDPTDPLFAEVAARFYQVQTELFGDSTMYKMDLLHEGGKAGDVDVPDASRAVQDALEAAHPGALWTILGWQRNPLPATLQAIDRSKMFIVDGITEQPDITDRDADFFGTAYAFGTIWNFGGHQNFGAALAEWNTKFHRLLAKPGTAMNGIALMPEGIDNNPAAVAFFADLAWQDAPVDLHEWFAEYATARYGAHDPHATAAWQTIADTAYSWPPDADTRHVTGLQDDQPGLGNTGYPLQYDIATFDKALGDLLQVDKRLRRNDAYRYDLVDVGRQVLANHSRILLPRISDAYAAGDREAFDHLTDQWLDQLQLMDDLLGTDPNFLLGRWQAEASRQAADPAEDATLQYNLKSLVSLWATGTDLQDYARREFNGLVGDYYAGRWATYFDTLRQTLGTDDEPAAIDWAAVAEDWAGADTRYPSEPTGSAYDLAQQVAALPTGELAVAAEHRGVEPGGTADITTTFHNTNVIAATGRVEVTLTAPDGYRVQATSASTAQQLAPDDTLVTTWTVAVPDGAPEGDLSAIDADVRWTSGDRGDLASAGTSLLISGQVPDDYRTVATTDAAFATTDDGIAIAAGGDDLWKGSAEYAAAFRTEAIADQDAVTSTVTTQSGAGPYARSGLIVANDLADTGSGGFANLAVTPEHGCMLSWDSDGNGQLDTYSEVGGFTAPVHLRLAKDGERLTGACSSDGQNWSVVGTATVPGSAAALDVGVFVSAVNRHSGTEAIASFTDIVPAEVVTRDDSNDAVQSVGKPVSARSSEPTHPAKAANDGSRKNSPYWGGPLDLGSTWWQVDLGALNDLSSVNVRNYVDGKREYTYRLEGSADGEHWFTLGGRSSGKPATDAGDTATVQAQARYVRVVGFSNTANATFHLSEVTVIGTPAG